MGEPGLFTPPSLWCEVLAMGRKNKRFSLPRRTLVPRQMFAHPLREAQRRRRPFRFERLEDRLLMTGNPGDGPGFVHNPYQPPPGPVIGQTQITATNDFYFIYNNQPGQLLSVLQNDVGPIGADSFRITEVSATSLGATVSVSADGRSIVYTPAAGQLGKDAFYYTVTDADGNIGKASVSVQLYSPPPVIPPFHGPNGDYYRFLEDEHNLSLYVL